MRRANFQYARHVSRLIHDGCVSCRDIAALLKRCTMFRIAGIKCPSGAALSSTSRESKWIDGIPQALVLGNPVGRLHLGREPGGGLSKRANAQDFDSEAVIFTMKDPVVRVGHAGV